MKKGDQTRICKYTQLDKAIVSYFFTGKEYISKEKREIIENAIKDLKIEYTPKQTQINLRPIKKSRTDIYNNLPRGAITKLANEFNFSYPKIIRILCNETKQEYNEIIKKAELMAAINIWKTRFCKYKSELNWEDV